MSEKEEKLEDVVDMKKVKENEGTVLGKTSVAQIGREVATRDAKAVAEADKANEEIEQGSNEKETQENEREEK